MYSIATDIVEGAVPHGLLDLGMWVALANMVNERIDARPDPDACSIGSIGFTKPSHVPVPANADDLQYNAASYLRAMQDALAAIVPYYSNHTLTSSITSSHASDLVFFGDDPTTLNGIAGIFSTPTGIPLSGGTVGVTRAIWNFVTIRAAAGLPAMPNPYSLNAENCDTNILWRRFKPREISSSADTADAEGNAAAAGQAAFNAGDHGFPYRCVSSGNWVRDNSVSVDVLANTAAAPDAIVNPHSSADRGRIRTGDYIRCENLQEVRLIANLLQEVWHDSHSNGFLVAAFIGFDGKEIIVNSTVSAADINTKWAAATPTTCNISTAYLGGPATAPTLEYNMQTTGGPSGHGVAWHAQGTQVTPTVSAAAIPHTVRWLGFVSSFETGYGHNDTWVTEDYDSITGVRTQQAIDDQGISGVQDLRWHLFHQDTTSSSTSESYQYLDVTSPPPNVPTWSPPPAHLSVRYLGWTMTCILVLVNYRDGYAYKF